MNFATLYAAVRRLGVATTLLHVGAHPDDEEIGLLAYTSFEHFGRAVYWSATRGEGGQNMINSYQGDALGVYRTWESLAARRIDGGHCLFGSFVDFGFSKSAEQTFSRWGRRGLTRQLVEAIRTVQPHIVVGRWEGVPEDGHGQHQAVGLALRDACELAADPDAFPELLERGCAPWRAVKFYISQNKTINPAGRRDQRHETCEFASVNTGRYSPLLGCTCQEQAWKAYLCHRSQGIKALPKPGDFYYYFGRIRDNCAAPCAKRDLFDGLDHGLAGLFQGLAHVPEAVTVALRAAGAEVDEALARLAPGDPGAAARPLLRALDQLRLALRAGDDADIDDAIRLALTTGIERKVRDCERAAAACLGLRLEAVCTRARITPGESVWVRGQLRNGGSISPDEVEFTASLLQGSSVNTREDELSAAAGGDAFVTFEAAASNDAQLSCPYWLARPREQWVYNLPAGQSPLPPLSPPMITVHCTVRVGQTSLTLSQPALHRVADDGAVRELPVSLVPPISLHPQFSQKIMLVKSSPQIMRMSVTVRCNDEEQPAGGDLSVAVPPGWKSEPSAAQVNLAPADGAQSLDFKITVPAKARQGSHQLGFAIRCRDRDYGVTLDTVSMSAGEAAAAASGAGAREAYILRPATVALHLVDARYERQGRYAYIRGADEPTANILRGLGLHLVELDAEAVSHGDLTAYNAVMAGPNAYLLRPELRENAHRLLEYVAGGGTLVVQHQGYGYEARGLAPRPFAYNIPHDRVTDEKAEVTLLDPDDGVFHHPNVIGPADFDGWVRDRGTYFFGQWDQRYKPLLSCADPGEPPKKGGLLRCDHGRGVYFYVGYTMHKQLLAGVPGAYRLLFNLLSARREESCG